ncbi:enolase 4-like [Diadema antillarum]|uniref:enolase 4-like n=1 Tax=Diadema antillarum TaxID=105358 RepID=UPI003A88FEF7
MAASRASERNAREFYETKQRAVNFYRENRIPEQLEEILNSMFYDSPADVYGYLAEYFETLAKPPSIHKVTAREVLDAKGQPTVQADITCIIKGLEKPFSRATASSMNHLPDNIPVEKKEVDEKERQQFTNAAVDTVNGPIREALAGLDPTQQSEVDDAIIKLLEKLKEEADKKEEEERLKRIEEELNQEPKEPAKEEKVVSPKGKKKAGSARSGIVLIEEPREPMYPGCSAACAVSQAVAMAGAAVKKVELYEHVSHLAGNVNIEEYMMPIPMMSVLSSGKPAPGKQNLIKELLLLPKPGCPLVESMKKLTSVYQQIGKLLFAKSGVAANYVNDLGTYTPQYDRQEQLLDLVQEAVQALELVPGEDIFMALNCAAHEIYEPEKNKYEVTAGLMKTPDDMVEFYADLISRYPAVVALIDPFRKQDCEPWSKLCERLSEKCYIIGEHVFPRVERFVREGFGELASSGVSLRMRQLTTVTDIIQASSLIKEEGSITMVASVPGDTSETFLADLAVGVRATFVKFGAPARGERTSKYNRLLQISESLKEQGQIMVLEEFAFPVKRPPTPPAEEGADGTSADQTGGAA